MSTEMAVGKQSVSVSGEGHVVTTIGGDVAGDVVLATTVMQQRPEFVSVPLDQFEPPRFPSPRIVSELIKVLRTHQVLVLGGNNEVDKDDLARHVAWYWRDALQVEKATDDQLTPVLEWRRTSDPKSLSVTFRTTTDATIFILPQLEPQDVHYDLTSIQKAAIYAQHYVIISTDKPFASWKLDPETKTTFWYELPSANLWDSEELANALIEALIDTQETLPAGLLGDDLAPDQPFVDKLLYRTVAERLRTPGNIVGFVRLLRAETELPQEAHVLELIERARGDERMLKQWYHIQLNAREQLLALGLSLLDGLFDDQFFAALEGLVGQVWRQRNPFLSAIDYTDLDNLGNFFKSFEPQQTSFSDGGQADGAYLPKIEIRSPDLRRKLLAVAWQSHRRRVLATLPALAQLAQDSVAGRSFNSELYGSFIRCDQLRRVISRTLAEIGLISARAIEGTLIQLAADDKIAVQAVTASAMAQWRDHGRDRELFDTLQRWQRETRILDLVDAILQGRDVEELEEGVQSVGPRAYIRATVALTVSYAAQYDRPNQLSEELCDLLQDIADDPTPLVNNRFCNHTLPWVVSLHLAQLRDFLHDLLIEQSGYSRSIGVSLARAYAETPDEVVTTLDQWTQECNGKKPKSKTEITSREALLATVARTYGHIEYDPRIGSLTVDDAFDRLKRILSKEKHPDVRKAVMDAVKLQTRRDFEQVESLLPNLLEAVTEEERDDIVQMLTEIYLQQRQNLGGGDETVKIDDKRYQVWMSPERRPMTIIERALFRWIKDADHMLAQQVATQAAVAFADKLDQREEKTVRRIKTRREEQKKAEPETRPLPTPTSGLRSVSFFQKLAARIATMGPSDHYYPIICGLLPEVLVQRRTNQTTVKFVLDKWRDSQDGEINTIAARIGQTVSLTGLLKGLGWLLLIVIVIVVIIAASNS